MSLVGSASIQISQPLPSLRAWGVSSLCTFGATYSFSPSSRHLYRRKLRRELSRFRDLNPTYGRRISVRRLRAADGHGRPPSLGLFGARPIYTNAFVSRVETHSPRVRARPYLALADQPADEAHLVDASESVDTQSEEGDERDDTTLLLQALQADADGSESSDGGDGTSSDGSAAAWGGTDDDQVGISIQGIGVGSAFTANDHPDALDATEEEAPPAATLATLQSFQLLRDAVFDHVATRTEPEPEPGPGQP